MTPTKPQFDKTQIAHSFNQAIKTYDEAAIMQREVGEQLLLCLNQVSPAPPKTILDLGSGTGVMSAKISNMFPQAKVLGIDIANNMIKHAGERFCRNTNLSFLHADADALPLADASIDLIISNLMLQWSPNLLQTFAELQRILQPNGNFLFTTLGPHTLNELRTACATVDPQPHVSSFVAKEQLLHALAEARFRQLNLETRYHYRSFTTLYDLMIELKMLGAHNLRQDRHGGLSGKTKFARLQKAYEKFRNTTDGKLPTTYEVYYVHATR